MKRPMLFLLMTVFFINGCGAASSMPDNKASDNSDSSAIAESTSQEATSIDVVSTEINPDKEENGIQNEAIRAYADFLKKERQEYEGTAFALIHVDDDEVPELVIVRGDVHPDCPVFYTYTKSGMVELGGYGSFGVGYYEKGSGIMFGFYTGMGTCITAIGHLRDGVLEKRNEIGITDLSAVPSGRTGYDCSVWGTGFEEGEDVSVRVYMELLSPYRPESRNYREINYRNLPTLHETEDIESALWNSLEKEEELPEADVEWYYSGIILPDETEENGFEENALDKLQGVWTSVGNSNSTSWVINGRTVRIYDAIWKEDMSGPTDEYELSMETQIESIEEDVGQWEEGEFLIRLKDGEGYYVYREAEGETLLDNHWDPDGYSGSSSMFKDKEKDVSSFSQ